MEILKVVGLLVLLLMPIGGIGSCMVGGCCPNYSDGFRVGTIQKFSKKGIFWKTWEGEMVLQSLAYGDKGQVVGMEKFYFTVPLDQTEVQAQVKFAMESEFKTKIHYHQYLFGPVTQDARSTATKVEVIK